MMKDMSWPEIEARIEKEDAQIIAYAEKYLQWLFAVDENYCGDEADPAHSEHVMDRIVAVEEILRRARGQFKEKGKRK
jgi:hypothetical protein